MTNILQFPILQNNKMIKNNNLKMGDYVKSYKHANGIFKIISMDQDDSSLVEIKSITSPMILLIPKSKLVPISLKKDIDIILDSHNDISVSNTERNMKWNTKHRYLSSKLHDNKIQDLILILKILAEKHSVLSFGEKKTLAHVTNILVTEYSLSSNLDRNQALIHINNKLNVSNISY